MGNMSCFVLLREVASVTSRNVGPVVVSALILGECVGALVPCFMNRVLTIGIREIGGQA